MKPFLPKRVLAAAVCACVGGVFAASLAADPVTRAPHCATPPSALSRNPGYGGVQLANSCSPAVQGALQLETARLHSFESAVSRFEAIGKRDPGCAIAFWGAAMSARGNPLGGVLGDADLATGRRLVDAAIAAQGAAGTGTPREARTKTPREAQTDTRRDAYTNTPREAALIGAMDVYYRPYPDQTARARAYAGAMDAVHAAYPDDPDIAAFDALAIIEGVDLSDKTYARQKRAGAILEAVMAAHPDHPGAPHYLIHAYDYTALAPRAVHAAEIYPTLATASSHAQHMPAHIWSMLGAWDKSIRANRLSEALIDPAAGRSAVAGDIVFEHAFDFIAYARLQRGEDRHVAADLAALGTGAPLIVRARFALERDDWAAAAAIPVPTADPFDTALARFTRAYGAARAGDAVKASRELAALEATRPLVRDAEGAYWAVFVDIYARTLQAWIAKAQGDGGKALAVMAEAAAMDDGHEKHIYLENKILPVRESLGDLETELGHPAAALEAYRRALSLAPNRYRAFLGAAQAAAALGDRAAARGWYERLVALSQNGDASRPGLGAARAYLAARG